MKALITGGCGFIGSHIADVLLARGFDVVVVDNLLRGKYIWDGADKAPLLIEADITDSARMLEIFEEQKPDHVYHMAAHHYIPFCENNPFDAFQTNVNGTLNVVNAVHKLGTVERFFLASTGDVYAPCSYPHREADTASPVYFYGETKLICEQILKRYKSSGDLKTNVLIGRIFNAAGKRETNPHFLPEMVRQLEKGAEKLEVGNLWPVRDFVDVVSMGEAIVDATNKIQGLDVVNIGSGQPQTVENALTLITKARSEEIGRDIPVESVEARKRPNDRPYLCPGVDKLVTLIGRACKPFNEETAKEIWAVSSDERTFY